MADTSTPKYVWLFNDRACVGPFANSQRAVDWTEVMRFENKFMLVKHPVTGTKVFAPFTLDYAGDTQ